VTNGNGGRLFKVVLGVEKEEQAHSTLELRSFFRQLEPGKVPDDYYRFLQGRITRSQLFDNHPAASDRARDEAKLATLGLEPSENVDMWISKALGHRRTWVLVGGPPCQAYSVAGRSRLKGVKDYSAEKDVRHFLYREYLRIISRHWPAAFIFENVKGLLSASMNGTSLFDRILSDLRAPASAMGDGGTQETHEYRVWPLTRCSGDSPVATKPSDFIVKAEQYGIPQARHRIFLLGIRTDLGIGEPRPLAETAPVACRQVLGGIPPIRSLLPRSVDSGDAWKLALRRAENLAGDVERCAGRKVAQLLLKTIRNLDVPECDAGGNFVECKPECSHETAWFIDEKLGGVCNHEGRNHIPEDLHRYLFAACFARVHGHAARLRDFPASLLPKHKNVQQALKGGYFQDRFRVQLENGPSTTVTSHIAKDGHHFIHPDQRQCRTLSPREAARLQTFPDNYVFCGPRTSQYIQLGNAVPPLLARQIAAIVADCLGSDSE